MVNKLKPVIFDCIDLILAILPIYFEWILWDECFCLSPDEDGMDIINTFNSRI